MTRRREPKLDAHAKVVAEAQETLKKLDELLSYHEALVATMREQLAKRSRT